MLNTLFFLLDNNNTLYFFYFIMHQLIQERNVSFALLSKAEVLCKTWYRLQSKSLNLLQSIHNVISQRAATFDLPSTLEAYGVETSQLVFKQTESMESSLSNMRVVLELFEKVISDWQKLEIEAARHVTKSLTAVVKPQPLSTESMIQVTAVNPTQVHEMIYKLAYMHKEEFNYKTILFVSLPSYTSTHTQFQNLLDHWMIESRIDGQIERDISERIKLYKTVKRVLLSGKNVYYLFIYTKAMSKREWGNLIFYVQNSNRVIFTA